MDCGPRGPVHGLGPIYPPPMHQFGYVQSIPPQPVDSWESFDEIDDRWMHYLDHLVPAGEMCAVPGQCTLDSIDWFFVISHPFMTAAQPSNPS